MKIFLITIFASLIFSAPLGAKPPTKSSKSKFYDFNAQLIDGAIKRPTAIYTSAREAANFGRLFRLKKSLLPRLFQTSKHKVFK